MLLDADLRVRKASRCFLETFELTRKRIETAPLYELGSGEWNQPRLRQLLEDVLTKNRRLANFKLERHLPRLGRRTWLLSARRLENKGERHILLAMESMTGPVKARLPASGAG